MTRKEKELFNNYCDKVVSRYFNAMADMKLPSSDPAYEEYRKSNFSFLEAQAVCVMGLKAEFERLDQEVGA